MIARLERASVALLAALGACTAPRYGGKPVPEEGFGSSEFGMAVATPRTVLAERSFTSFVIDDRRLFWISPAWRGPETIESIDLEGHEQRVVVGDLRSIGCLTADRDDLYWCNAEDWEPRTLTDRISVTRATRMRDLPPDPPQDPAKTVKIMRTSRRGSAPAVVAGGFSSIRTLAVTPLWIYVVSYDGHYEALSRVSKDGKSRAILGYCAAMTYEMPYGPLLAAADDVYWSCETELSKVTEDGKLVHVATERSGYRDLSAGPRAVCWVTGSHWIFAAFANEPPKVVARDQSFAHVACSADSVAWSNEPGWDPVKPTIVEARAGSRPVIRFSGDDRPAWVVTNDRHLLWYDAQDRAVRLLPRGGQAM